MYDLLYRLSTIQAADRIIVMDRGHIVEVGDLMIYFECSNHSYQCSFLNLLLSFIYSSPVFLFTDIVKLRHEKLNCKV
jgi:ABC-type sulfate/molybdate transport systems ATPase subunit